MASVVFKRRINRDYSGAPPFLSWEWMAAGSNGLAQLGRRECFARAGKGSLPDCCTGRRDAANCRPQDAAAGVSRRRTAGADYLDVLARPEVMRESAEAIFEYLAREGSFDVLELEGMAEDSPSLPIIARHLALARASSSASRRAMFARSWSWK